VRGAEKQQLTGELLNLVFSFSNNYLKFSNC
jgi:hypothetical protein